MFDQYLLLMEDKVSNIKLKIISIVTSIWKFVDDPLKIKIQEKLNILRNDRNKEVRFFSDLEFSLIQEKEIEFKNDYIEIDKENKRREIREKNLIKEEIEKNAKKNESEIILSSRLLESMKPKIKKYDNLNKSNKHMSTKCVKPKRLTTGVRKESDIISSPSSSKMSSSMKRLPKQLFSTPKIEKDKRKIKELSAASSVFKVASTFKKV